MHLPDQYPAVLSQYHPMNPKILYKQQILLLSPVRQNVSSYHQDHSIYLVFLLFFQQCTPLLIFLGHLHFLLRASLSKLRPDPEDISSAIYEKSLS